MSSAIFDSLTAAQREAVECLDGPLLILAGPGSGKTRVVTHRIANMVQHGISPSRILALTFTNKAADEMKERIQRLSPGCSVWVGTFHRFCSRLLRRYANLVGLESNFTIYDMQDSRQALKRVLKTVDLPLTMTTPDKIGHQISWLKNHLVTAEDYEPREGHEMSNILTKVYPAYQRELLSCNAVDFDDLLLHVVALLRQSPDLRSSLDAAFQYVMVDEYQDTNLAQYAIVRGLSNDYPNLAVTGDPDQSIYGWRGANLSNILDFEKDYPNVHVVRLEQNYRSTPAILQAAQELISNNQRRKAKNLFTENPDGDPVRIVIYGTHRDEADGIISEIAAQIRTGKRRPRDFAIFYRINALSRTLEHVLREQSIPYQIVNGVEFYQRKEIKDVLAYLHLIYNPNDNSSMERIINVPPRRIGKTSVGRLADYAVERGIPMLDAASNSDTISQIPKATRPKLKQFAEMIRGLGQRYSNSVEELIGLVLSETGYLDQLRASGTPEDDERAANVEELLAEAREFDESNAEPDVLGAFLDRTSLVNDIDDWDEQTDRVTLMTLHAAKGLEFPSVYMIGVEQGLLPHDRSLGNLEQEEEERRLMFVGITRAQQNLQLSYARIRAHRGGLSHTIPSRFLMELPRHEMDFRDQAGSGITRESADDHLFYHDLMDDVRVPSHLQPRPHGESVPGGNPTTGRTTKIALQTAADLLSEQRTAAGSGDADSSDTGQPIDPNSFEIGMTVMHPTFGLGKIAALSGYGKSRTGTINFATSGQKRFVLAKSPIRPLNSRN
jgi:DNA helicase-2/ATP-dependent DNA helicase PcrA